MYRYNRISILRDILRGKRFKSTRHGSFGVILSSDKLTLLSVSVNIKYIVFLIRVRGILAGIFDRGKSGLSKKFAIDSTFLKGRSNWADRVRKLIRLPSPLNSYFSAVSTGWTTALVVDAAIKTFILSLVQKQNKVIYDMGDKSKEDSTENKKNINEAMEDSKRIRTHRATKTHISQII